ncbi:MAG: lipid-A-disaccharide synthase [Nitrospirota bacterium]
MTAAAAPTIFISTGEASGDLHGAKLAAALMRQRPGCRVAGMGGHAMRAAGARVLVGNEDLGVVGLWEVLAHGGAIWRAYRAVKQWLSAERPDVVVLVDYPDFHFQIARLAKRLGLRVVYYISPQIWAWRSGRVRTVARLVDHMMVILPFEVDLYRSAGVPCTLIGHPLLDDVQAAPTRADARARLGLPPAQPVVGLFPGSRRAEIRRHLPVMLAAARRLASLRPDALFLVSHASSIPQEEFDRHLRHAGLPVRVHRGEPTAMLAAADAAMTVSGTITLQAALFQLPMVIIYKVATLTWLAARLLVRVPHVSLPNLIAGEPIVPELLQSAATPEAIGDCLAQWLANPDELAALRKRLAGVRDRLGEAGGSEKAAATIFQCLEQWRGSREAGAP